MARAIDVIQRALRLIGVAQTGEALEAETASDALSVLNNLFAELYANIGIPDYSVAGLTTTLTIDKGDVEAMAYQLALRIAPEYGFSVNQDFQRVAEESLTRLRNRYFVAGRTDFSELPLPSSVSYNYDITSDN